MDKGSDEQEGSQPTDGDDGPPPFNPDPRIVTYLEGDPKNEAQERFRELIERKKRTSPQRHLPSDPA